MRLIEGQLIHRRYRLDSRLAQGGMGEVWKGFDIQLRRPVAIKALRTDTTNQESKLRRLRAGARNSANLAHPNIAALFEYYEHDGIRFLIMECVPSKSLADLFRTSSTARWTPPSCCRSSCRWRAACSWRIPARRDPTATSSRRTSWSPTTARSRSPISVSRTPRTRSRSRRTAWSSAPRSTSRPSEAQGKHATPQSDIYSLGVVAYEGLCGAPRPFTGATPVDIAAAHVNNPVPPLPASVDFQLSQFVMSMLSKDPLDRPNDALTVARILTRIQRRLLDQQTSAADATMITSRRAHAAPRGVSAPHHDRPACCRARPMRTTHNHSSIRLYDLAHACKRRSSNEQHNANHS